MATNSNPTSGLYPARLSLDDGESRMGKCHGDVTDSLTKRAKMVFHELWAERRADGGVISPAMRPGWNDTPAISSRDQDFTGGCGSDYARQWEGADTMACLTACPQVIGNNRGK